MLETEIDATASQLVSIPDTAATTDLPSLTLTNYPTILITRIVETVQVKGRISDKCQPASLESESGQGAEDENSASRKEKEVRYHSDVNGERRMRMDEGGQVDGLHPANGFHTSSQVSLSLD